MELIILKKYSILRIVLFSAGVVIFAVCIFFFTGYSSEKHYYNNLVVKYKQDTNQFIDSSMKMTIDDEGLKSINSEYVAWIHSDGLLDYPIVQGKDNEFYLKHSFDGTDSSHGCLFVDQNNESGFNDNNTYIFGHNMRDDSMFGKLNDYMRESVFKKYPSFQIITKEEILDCNIFSVYRTELFKDDFRYFFSTKDEFNDYLVSIKNKSIYDTGVEVGPTDKIITLVTCTSRESDERMIVHGVIN